MFEDMVKSPSGWLSGKGEENKVVLSARVRLARNIAGCVYPAAADSHTKEKVIDYFESALAHSDQLKKGRLLKSPELSSQDRDFLVERHLMSPTFMNDGPESALYIGDGEQVSIMINEEDHFRIQSLMPGFGLDQALAVAATYDNEIGKFLEFDYDPDFGFLTACPTNVGTGMRASVLIHLPGLVITKDIEKMITRISKIGVSVRGFYGEGSDVLGNLFQISNQVTLGIAEKEILELVGNVTRSIIDDEIAARKRLLDEASNQITDKIWRAFGILKYAQVLTSEEVMNLLSAVRLGAAMGIIDFIDIPSINEILLLSQPAHLQKYFSKEMNPEERDVVRAMMVREKLKHYLN